MTILNVCELIALINNVGDVEPIVQIKKNWRISLTQLD